MLARRLLQRFDRAHSADASRRPHDEAEQLSVREKEILRLIASGYTSAEIGARLLISTMTVNGKHTREVLEHDFSNATDMADYLAKKGLPFRQAHAVVGGAVHYCIEHHKVLHDLTMEEFKSMSPLFEEDILEALKIENCVKNRESYGGTGPKSVERQKAHGKEAVAAMKEKAAQWKESMAFLG